MPRQILSCVRWRISEITDLLRHCYGNDIFYVLISSLLSWIEFCDVMFVFILFCFSYGACSPITGYDLLILEVFRSRTTTHRSRQDSSGRVISPSQRPLPDNTQQSQQTSMPSAGFEPTISAGERPQTYALDRAGIETGTFVFIRVLIHQYVLKEWTNFHETCTKIVLVDTCHSCIKFSAIFSVPAWRYYEILMLYNRV